MDIDSGVEQVEAVKTELLREMGVLRRIMGKFRGYFPDDIESSFFSIVRKFCLLIASISLLVVALWLLLSLNGYMASVDEDHSDPDVSYNDYKEELQIKYDQTYATTGQSGSSKTEQKERKLIADSERLEFEKEFDKYYNEFVITVNEYAKIVGDDPVHDGVRDFLLKMAVEDNDLGFMDDLNDFVEDMRDDANEVKTLNADDVRRTEWLTSLNWWLDARKQHTQTELARINYERAQAMDSKAEALTQLMVVGVAFALFMYFVIILVLMRIESNTRVQTTK